MIDGVKWGYGLGGNMEYDPIIKRDTYVTLPETKQTKNTWQSKIKHHPNISQLPIFQSTPWKIDMEPTNEPVGKEQLSSKPPGNYVPC